jgi:DnaJ-class molecular chaperone
MSKKSYYEILEVSEGATLDEITTAYKRLRFKWHPDKNPDNVDFAKAKFQEINDAYEILKNEESREKYDNRDNNMRDFDPFGDIINNITKNKKKEGQEVMIKISIQNIFTGVHKKIKIKSLKKCQLCNIELKKCNACNGNKMIMQIIQRGMMIQQIQRPCDKCKETGYIKKTSNCDNCKGKGTTEISEEHTIILNKNDDYLKNIILKGKGNYNFETQKDNDIIVKIDIKDSEYDIKKYDLIYKFYIDIKNAFCCDNLYFKHPNGKIYSFISQDIITNESVKIIPKLGLPSSYSNGDLVIKFLYKYPKNKLSENDFNLFINNIDIEKYEKYENINLLDFENYKKNNINEEDEEEEENIKFRSVNQQQCNPS